MIRSGLKPGHRLSRTIPVNPVFREAWAQWAFLARFDLGSPMFLQPKSALSTQYLDIGGSPALYGDGRVGSYDFSISDGFNNMADSLLGPQFPGKVDSDFTWISLYRMPTQAATFKSMMQKAAGNGPPVYYHVSSANVQNTFLTAAEQKSGTTTHEYDKWVVGAVRYDAAADTVEFFYDGQPAGSGSSATFTVNADPLNIGCRNPGTPALGMIGQIAWIFMTSGKLPNQVLAKFGADPMLFLMDRDRNVGRSLH